ncbi:hypothetical protein [Lactococcus fujiensis]|nr:hypothetical protein [Lactococcus fujiensis]
MTEHPVGEPYTITVDGLSNTFISVVPAGETVGTGIDQPIVDETVKTRDRIMVTHGTNPSQYFTSAQGGKTAVFFRNK